MYEMWRDDRPVLAKVVELCESGGDYLEPQRVLDAFPEDQRDAVLRSLRRFVENEYINAVTTQGMGDRGPQILIIKGVTEKGLRAVGAYPASDEQMVHALLAAIDEAVENAPDAEQQSKLQAARSALAGLSLDTLSGLATVLIAKFTGLA